jgi:cellobiose-specific phosphotransferase system component IIA
MNVLHNADSLIREAEARIRAHDPRRAEMSLAQAATALLNARAAGEAVPDQAIQPLDQARSDLHRGRMAASERKAEAARQIIASAE